MKQVTKEARTNAEKGQLLYQYFFPKRTAPPAEDTDYTTTQEKWVYTHTTNDQIPRAIKRMKPWKATCSDLIPNAVFIHARVLLVLYLGPILRATDTLKIYPEDWKLSQYFLILVLNLLMSAFLFDATAMSLVATVTMVCSLSS